MGEQQVKTGENSWIKEGDTIIDGQKMNGEDLKARLLALKKDKPIDVVLAGDRDASLQTLLKAMDGVRAAGITSVGIAAKAEKPAAAAKK